MILLMNDNSSNDEMTINDQLIAKPMMILMKLKRLTMKALLLLSQANDPDPLKPIQPPMKPLLMTIDSNGRVVCVMMMILLMIGIG